MKLPKEFVGKPENRSASDNGKYVSFVRSAVNDYTIFETFKQHKEYKRILEHCTYNDGLKFIDSIKQTYPEILNNLEAFKDNDIVGTPTVYEYPEIGQISASTLRYIKVSADLLKLFGTSVGDKIAEIGCGYGGQLLINDKIFNMKEYHVFDLPPVLDLTSKYLENHILDCSYKISTLNQCAGDIEYDLVISNYAFSELPSQLERKYIEKILSKSKRGYLTMNSGLENSPYKNTLSINELTELLPPFEILPDVLEKHNDNYIIVWGHK